MGEVAGVGQGGGGEEEHPGDDVGEGALSAHLREICRGSGAKRASEGHEEGKGCSLNARVEEEKIAHVVIVALMDKIPF